MTSPRPQHELRALARLIAVLSIIVATLTVSVPPSASHPPADYYVTGTWAQGTREDYFFGQGVPNILRVQNSITLGVDQWNNLGENVLFSFRGYNGRTPIIFPNCEPNNVSYVFQRDIGTDYAETYNCGVGGVLTSFNLTFDDRPWYSDTGDPPDGFPDRWSVSSHEFGHANGFFNHWPANSPRCVNYPQQLTMCPFHFTSTQRQRTLGDHDIHTFQAAY